MIGRLEIHRSVNFELNPENPSGYDLSLKEKQLETCSLLQNDRLLIKFLILQKHIIRCFTFEAIPQKTGFRCRQKTPE